MKKKLLFALSGLLCLLSPTILNAQCPTLTIKGQAQVCTGSTTTYFGEISNALPANLLWSVVDPATNSPVSTSVATINFRSGFQTSIIWNTAGTYLVTVASDVPPSGCTSPLSASLLVTIVPSTPIAAPTSISGLTAVCTGVSSSTYSVPAVSGLSPMWSLERTALVYMPTVATLTPSGNQVIVNWNGESAGTYVLAGYYSNGSCTGSQQTIQITRSAGTVTPTLSSNPTSCVGETSTFYAYGDPQDTFTWSITGGGSLVSSGKSATVQWTTAGSFTVTASATNPCNATPRTVSQTTNVGSSMTTPGVVTKQNSTTCANQPERFSVASIPGATTYTWDVTFGTTHWSVSTTTPYYDYTFPYNGTGSIKVTASNGYCVTSPSPALSFNVGVSLSLNIPPSLCAGNPATLQVTSTSDISNLIFNWDVGDGIINGPSTGSSVSVTWNTGGQKIIRALTTTACGAAGAGFLSSTEVHSSSFQLGSISGVATACLGTYRYTCASNETVNKNWTVTLADGSSASGRYTTSTGSYYIDITWKTVGDYKITCSATNDCSVFQSQSLTVHVGGESKPTVGPINNTSTETICATPGSPIVKTYSVTATAGVTYTWSLTDYYGNTMSSAGNTANVTWTYPSTSSIVNVTPSTSTCQGEATSLYSTFGYTPSLTTSSTFTTCSDVPLNIALTSNVSGAYFAWSASSIGNVSGQTTKTSYASAITDVITNYSNAPQAVIYTVTPVKDYCTGPQQTITVTVNPVPTTYSNTSSVCSGSNINYALTSSIPSSFTWAATDNVNTSGESTTNQNSSTITDVINNPTMSPQTLVYTVTPTSSGGGCIGAPKTLTFSINPKPSMTSASSSTVCSGTGFSIPLTSTVASSFSWSAADNPNTTGELTTTQSAATLANTITNTTSSPQSVLYTVTPTSTLGCIGAAQTVTAVVNPIPTASASNQTICSGQTTSMLLNSTVSGTSFSWSAPVQTGVSGGSAGAGSSINQLLSTTSTASGTANYTVTPSANSCTGAAIHVIATVNRTPTITNSSLSNSICSGTPLSFVPTVSISGTTFAWTSAITGTVTGVSASGSSNITDTPVNTGTAPATIVYTITPILSGCSGPPVNYTVTVNPTPTVTAANQNICSGSATNIALSAAVGGTTFSWSAPTQTNVSGGAAGSGSNIAQTLSVVSAGTGTASYSVTPSANGCFGSAYNVQVQVTTTPVVTASNQLICSGQTTNIPLTSNVSGTTFTWPLPTMTNATGGSGGSGSSIAQTLTGTSSSTGQITYSVTPAVNGCTGTVSIVTASVIPKPVGSATSQTINSGQTSAVALTSTVSGTTFSWNTPTQSNVTGGTGGSGSSINQTLVNTSGSLGSAAYSVIPAAQGCPGSAFTATIFVNPDPRPVGSTKSNPINIGMLNVGSTYTDTKNNSTSNNFGDDYTTANTNGQSSDDIYYYFSVPVRSNVQITTQGSDFDTYIHLLDENGNQLAYNDDFGGGSWSFVTTNLAPGNYYVVAEGYSTRSGNIALKISTNTPRFPITWQDIVNVSVNNNTITKSATDYTWTAGAASSNYIPANTDGWIEMTLKSTTWDIMFGLSSTNPNASWNTIEYNCYISRRNGNVVEIYKLGTQIVGNAAGFAVGDKFRVERSGGLIYFKRNGLTIYVMTGNAAEVLRADVSMFDPNSQIADAYCSHSTGGQPGRFITFPENLTVGSYDASDSTKHIGNTLAYVPETISPNPTNGKFTIRCASDNGKEAMKVKVLNSVGAPVYATVWYPTETGYQLPIDLENQAAGVYIVYIDEKTFKLVKN